MESLGKTVVSVYRKEWAEEEEQPPAISSGAIRNERTKVNKQLKDKKLDWKYVNGLVEFAMATYDQATLVKRIGDMRQKYRNCKKELIEVQESQEVIIKEKVDEIIETQYEEKMNEKKEEMEEETILLKQRVEVQSQMIQNLMRKNEKNFNKVEELQKRPTRESYDDLQNRYDEYVASTQSLKKSESTTSLSSNDDDSKIKKKYKKLKSKCDKLELENFKLKQKINNKDDSDSDSDCSSSDEDVITEEL
jgi:hypothetical protein